jgi:hypothetical protein
MWFVLLSLLSALSATTADPFAPAQSENSANAEFMNSLLRRGTPLRRGLANYYYNYNNNNYHSSSNVDLTTYSIVFKKCQFVKTYSDELAYIGSSTVLKTNRFVIFRLCPSGTYCNDCNFNSAEYIIDLYDYLEAMLRYQKEIQINNCTACSNTCAAYATTDDKVAQKEAIIAADDGQIGQGGRYLSSSSSASLPDAKACKSCLDECKFISNLRNEGYYEAADFTQCTKIYDDGSVILHAGPVCTNGGNKIKIGVFTDNACYNLDSSKNPSDYLKNSKGASMKLSYNFLKKTYTSACVPCAYSNNGVEKTSKFCAKLYDQSGKCEKSTGFTAGVVAKKTDAVQVSDEALVCQYISSLLAGTYSESGEMYISGASSVMIQGGYETTGTQKLALTFFVLGTVALAIYAALLRSSMDKNGSDSRCPDYQPVTNPSEGMEMMKLDGKTKFSKIDVSDCTEIGVEENQNSDIDAVAQ